MSQSDGSCWRRMGIANIREMPGVSSPGRASLSLGLNPVFFLRLMVFNHQVDPLAATRVFRAGARLMRQGAQWARTRARVGLVGASVTIPTAVAP